MFVLKECLFMKNSKIFMVSMALCALFTVSPSLAMEGGRSTSYSIIDF